MQFAGIGSLHNSERKMLRSFAIVIASSVDTKSNRRCCQRTRLEKK